MLKSLNEAVTFVDSNPNARWAVWGKTIIIHRPHNKAEFYRNGRYNRDTGKFGYEKVIEVNSKGKFFIPTR